VTALQPYLATVPDELHAPVQHYWQLYAEVAAEAGLRVPQHPDTLRHLVRVWAGSRFVAESCIQYPLLLDDLLRSGDLYRDYFQDEYVYRLHDLLRDVRDESRLMSVLRHWRRYEMLRIAWRDQAGWSTLDATMAEVSALADACIDGTLYRLHEWQCRELGEPQAADGTAQQMVVLGMGKLGGNELNFSSDIDLIFCYPRDGETRGRRRHISNQEYFTRLGQRLIRALDAITEDGLVFRVDMRLRPFGDSGPLASSFDVVEEYYQLHGREWERYALIKCRVVAGDQGAGAALMKRLQPFVYRRYLDYGALESMREMKTMIVH